MYTVDDLQGPSYADLTKGEEARIRIEGVEVKDNQFKPGRKDIRLSTVVVNGSQEGKVLNTTLFDGSQMLDVLKGLLVDESKVLNLLNTGEGTSALIGRTLLVTAKDPKINDKGQSFTQIGRYEILG